MIFWFHYSLNLSPGVLPVPSSLSLSHSPVYCCVILISKEKVRKRKKCPIWVAILRIVVEMEESTNKSVGYPA